MYSLGIDPGVQMQSVKRDFTVVPLRGARAPGRDRWRCTGARRARRRSSTTRSCPKNRGHSIGSLTIKVDHVSLPAMESIPVSKFKATCLAVLQRVKRTGRPVLVTRFGQPVAQVAPPARKASKSDWLGAMAGRAKIIGDVVGPAADAKTWSAMSR